MFVWLIEGKLAKAAYTDPLPEGGYKIIVAAEYDTKVGLVDEPIISHEQKENFINAVTQGIFCLAFEAPVTFICQQGLSRSVTVACCVAAFWNQTKFEIEWAKLHLKDDLILNPSFIYPLAKEAFPNLF